MAEAITDSILVIAQRLHTVLDAAKSTFTYADGSNPAVTVQDVWFDDQAMVPRTPALCVRPGTKRRPLDGVPDMTKNTIDTYILLYHAPVTEQQRSLREAIGVAEVVEQWLHNNHLQLTAANGDRLTIHSFVTETDPGYAYKGTTLHHAVQMTWSSLTKTRLKKI